MAMLVSSWGNNVQSMPADYIMPPEKRPGNFVTICKEIPVIDLGEKAGHDWADLARQIIEAGQKFGVFQVINHGVSEKVMQDTMNLYNEFFNMSVEDKLSFYSEDFSKACTLYTSTLFYAAEEVHYWNDTLKHPCHPLEVHIPSWPEKPARYREEVGRYSVEMRKLGLRILDLISKGLGLKEGYFRGELGQEQGMGINHYPKCPDPSLAMGIASHTDPGLITLIQQEVYGLQILKDGQWIGIEPLPNAFVVNLGYQMQIISNGKLKSIEHRVVTNSSAARTSIGTFFAPANNAEVEPAKELVTCHNPPIYKALVYREFLKTFLDFMAKKVAADSPTFLDLYKL